MPIFVKLPDAERTGEWAIIELQGDLESRSEETFSSQFIGDLHYTKFNIPVLIVGHHILYGKEVTLEKPIAVLEKQDAKSDHTTLKDCDTLVPTEYVVKAVIRRKLLFKTRPKPIIANVPKIV